MHCFNHHDTTALGICKNCNKGICKECLTEVDNGLACTSTCIEDVKFLNTMIMKHKYSSKTLASTQYKSAFIYAAFGLAFMVYGFNSDGLTGFTTIMGVIFTVGALLTLILANKYKK